MWDLRNVRPGKPGKNLSSHTPPKPSTLGPLREPVEGSDSNQIFWFASKVIRGGKKSSKRLAKKSKKEGKFAEFLRS